MTYATMRTKNHFFSLLVAIGLLLAANPVQAGGWLGITIEPPQGVQVAEIIKDSPADKIGLEKGDIIHQVDGTVILSLGHFMQIIATSPAGHETTLTLLRKGKDITLKVTLEDSEKHPSVSQGDLQHPRNTNPYANGFPHRYRPHNNSADRFFRTYDNPEQNYALAPPSPSAWLGVAPGPATDGVMVIGVAPNSPAEQAGLRSGDTIFAINRMPVTTPNALVQAIAPLQPGDLVEISFKRDGRTQMAQAPLQPPPSSP